MKKIITFIFGLITIAAYSQIIIPKTSDKGILITQTNEKIEYRNLKYANGKITYVNAENNVLEFLYENSLKSIEEGEQSLHTQVSDIEKLSEKSKEIKLTDKRDIKDFLDKHNNSQYKSGKSLNNLGTAFVVGGATCFVTGGLINLSSANTVSMTEEKRRGSSVPLIIGMLGAGAGIIMKIAGHSQMNKAVRAYRYSDSKKFVPVYYVLNDQNGVGVLMKF